MKRVKFELTVTESDYYKFQKSMIFRRFSPLKLSLGGCILAGIPVIWIIESVLKGEYLSMLLPTTMLTGLCVGFIKFYKRLCSKSISTNSLLKKPITYEINPEGLGVSSENGSVFIRWNEFYKKEETKDAYGLYISNAQMYFLPKNNLKDEEELAFVKQCISNISQVKSKKTGVFRRIAGLGILLYLVLFLVILVLTFMFATST